MLTPAQMAARFHDARDTVRRTWPNSWRLVLKPYSEVLRELERRAGMATLPAVVAISKQLKADDADMGVMLFYLAAAAELMEPTA